jgi:MFS family permease
MSDPAAAEPHGLRAVLAQRPYTRFLTARFASTFAVQMQTVAVGAQVYDLTRDPMDLGLIGLSQFLPFIVLVLFAGQAADRWNRKWIMTACYVVELLCAVALYAFTTSGSTDIRGVFAVMVLFGVARAFMGPAGQALMPNLVPASLFSNAVGLNSSVWQIATIAGPALGGILYAATSPASVYAIVAVLLVVSTFLMILVDAPRTPAPTGAATWHTVLEGLRFVWNRKPVLGAISLDLFAVLFGGATALLPAYASDVLHVGPQGLGWLRAAPGIGAALTGVWLSFRPIHRHAGPWMFGGVAVFGLATLAFGASTSFWLSMAALFVLGASDMVSVFVRHILVQLETPDAMRGRVGAVNSMFIGASNELGEFESGITAAWWGLVPAVLVGGAATLVVAALWAKWFPQLRTLDRFPKPPDAHG